MSNPLLNDRSAAEAARAGWGAPVSDGPVSPWQSTVRTQVMTVEGTATATGVLLVLLLAAAVVGWTTAPDGDGIPGVALIGMVVGLVCALAVAFRPRLARVLGPVYALAEGFFLGVVSRAYEQWEDGIVVQAVGATLAVFAVMLVVYRLRIIRVTDRFRRIVIGATMGLMVFYLGAFVIRLIAGSDAVGFLNSASPLGIGFSVLAAGLAAMMLAVDFDLIERGAAEKWPKGMEWFAAFGLLVTLVWLYLEMLRLLSKLNRR
ncbi:MAG: Bax inhibitor-1/YccA family protein [Ilumatobacteraceae bacterium]